MLPRRVAFSLSCGVAALVLLGVAWPALPQGAWGVALLALLLLLAPWAGLAAAQAILGGAILLAARDPAASVLPAARLPSPPGRSGRTAVAMCLRNEAMDAPLAATGRLLDGLPPDCDLWFLSDTRDEPFLAAEDAALRAFRAARPDARRIFLRRRATNAGFKAGNVMEFLDAEGQGYEYAVILDADSEMTAEAVLRLTGILENGPRIALVQQLIAGRPVAEPFPRLFQFGMRAGMRAWATGQGWWQGPQGPFWGHNAAFRVAPFRRHARLEGDGILSHDQLEAIALHGAGWEVWCFPEERGSLEGNPPALPEFLRRDERWAEGNMQYLALLRRPGLSAMARWQLVQAILLFLCAPLWALAFLVAVLAAAAGAFAGVPAGAIAASMLAWWLALHAPKLAGYAQVLAQGREAARYGGRARFAAGAGAELVFATLLSPVTVLGKTAFLLRLALGAKGGWAPQNRMGRGVGWGDAWRLLWPQALAGLALGALLAVAAPWALPFALPWGLLGLLLAVPFSVATTAPGLGRWLRRHGIAATPEELGGR